VTGLTIALGTWLAALTAAVIAGCRESFRPYRGAIIVWATLAALGLTPFWRHAIPAQASTEPVLAGPEVAYLSVWIIVLLPIIRRRLDGSELRSTLRNGLLAAAAVGMAQSLTSAPPDPVSAAWLTGHISILTGLFCVGLILCQACAEAAFPWDYPAWFSAWLTITAPAQSVLRTLELGADAGILLTATAFILTAWLYRAQSQIWTAQLLGISGVLLTPAAAGLLLNFSR